MVAHHSFYVISTGHTLGGRCFFRFGLSIRYGLLDFRRRLRRNLGGFRFLPDTFPVQAQAIGHHTHTTHRHSRSGYHRIEQESVNRIQDTGGNGHAYQVIDERPKQILTDGTGGEYRKADGVAYLAQVGRNQGHFSHIHRQIASLPHRDAEVGLRQRRTVVDAVTHHRHMLAFRLKLLDDFRLVLRKHLGTILPDTCLAGYGLCRHPIVSGQHNDRNALALQVLNGGFRSRLDAVGYGKYTQCLSGIGKPDDRLGFGSERLRLHPQFLRNADAVICQQTEISRIIHFAVHTSTDTLSRQAFHPTYRRYAIHRRSAFEIMHHGTCQRMFGMSLQLTKHGLHTDIRGMPYRIGHYGLAFGDGTCLVEYNGIYLTGYLQAFGVFYQNALFGSLTDTHHDSGRGSQSQGTGTSDNQYRHGG